jgi:SAM-dependent methyltransferase
MKRILLPTLPFNAVLTAHAQYRHPNTWLDQNNLPKHPDPPKNWDTFAALSIILNEFTAGRKHKVILDAGGEHYSVILPLLQKFGFTQLVCLNLSFKQSFRQRNIDYVRGDLTSTSFKPKSFDAITCLSVIEHGVDPEKYFCEMSRLLKPGGILITSADYWSDSVDTSGKHAYGVPVKIFDRNAIRRMISIARAQGLSIEGRLKYACKEKIISWLGLRYTFIYFTLRKTGNPRS